MAAPVSLRRTTARLLRTVVVWQRRRARKRLNGTEVESAAPFGCVAGSGLPDTRTLSPCDPIFFYYTAILEQGCT